MDDGHDGSVTRWIDHLKEGDPHAAHHLWQRYFHRIVALARTKLADTPRAVADEEDAALSAFGNLCEGAVRGRFVQLHNRDDLWHLLALITARKAADLRKQQGRLKRGGGWVALGMMHAVRDGESGCDILERIAGDDPGPEIASMLAEECQRRLDALGDASLRRVALLRLEGYSNDEIAEALGCARRTVARKLELIRNVWNDGVN